MNPFELRNMEAEGFKLFPNPLLEPVDTTKKGDTANVNNVSQVSNVNNANYTSAGLNGANNKDLDAFAMAQKYVSV